MTTTSVKLPDDLKKRAAVAAQRTGVSTHAFMVDAIRQTIDATEQRALFVEDAKTAREQALTSGKAIPADQVHAYIRDKSRGKTATRPQAKAWRE